MGTEPAVSVLFRRMLLKEINYARTEVRRGHVGRENYGFTLWLHGSDFRAIFLLVGVLGSIAGEDRTPFAGVVGIVLAVLMPVLYGVTGFVSGAIGALLYNLLAKWVGGFELELGSLPAGPVAPYPIIPPASSGV